MELGVNAPLRRAWGTGDGPIDAYKFLGLDSFLLWAGEGAARQPWGDKYEVDDFGRVWNADPWFYIGGALRGSAELDRFTPPAQPERRIPDDWRRTIRENSGHPFMFMFHGPLELAYESMGIEHFCLALYDDPDFIHELFRRRTDFFIALARRAVDIGCDYVMIGDDAAYKTGPLMSPRDYERFVIPCYERIIRAFDVPVLLHSDGFVWDLLPMIRDVGIRGIHPLEPIAGMTLAGVKAAYPDLVVMGNVDCGEVLCRGTLQDVRSEVDRCMREAKAGGRYILGSSNCLHDAVKPENAVEMYRYAREVGVY